MAFKLNNGFGGDIRTGIDFVCKRVLSDLSLPPYLSLCLPVLAIAVIFMRTEERQKLARFKWSHVGFMFLECLGYGACFGLVVSMLTPTLFSLGERGRLTELLTVSLGAGVYEEFVFRLVLFSGLVLFLKRAQLENRIIVYGLAGILSALVFAGAHHLAPFAEPFEIKVFAFRAMGGLVLSSLFVARGFGIVAYTHSFYNIFLIFRGG